MNYIESRVTNCLTLSTTDNILDWNVLGNSSNSSNDVLDIISMQVVSVSIYRQLNETHYQWCGPLFNFVEYFARFTSTRYLSILYNANDNFHEFC